MTNQREEPARLSVLMLSLDEVRQVVGDSNITQAEVDAGQQGENVRRNVSLFRPRDVRAVIRPGSVQEIQAIVRIFHGNNPPAGLHAISTGRNWGLGSAEPATDDVVTVDLGRMNSIRRVDCDAGYAVIEPGVTQLCLAEALDGTHRMLNVTASSGHTSVIGNALERGVGLRRQRTDDLLGLEIVLPDGELARVGWWPEQTKRTAANPYGLGPSLLHLFTQSNLGIVAAAVVSLLPRPESQRVLRLKFARSDLSSAMDTLRRWMAQDLVSGVLKVYDSASAASYGGAPDQHLALVCVSGTPRRVEAITEIVRAEVVESGLFGEMSMSDRAPAAANDFVLQVVEHAYAGSPSQNEHMLRSATGADFNMVDSAGGGWIFFLAFIPFDGASIDSALTLIERVHAELGIQAGTTVNALSSDVIDLVVSIKFTPTAEATAVAHGALNRIYELFTAIGFYPYRLDIDHSHWRERLMTDSGELKLSRRIRQLLDPHSILAPGRYV
ncbi:FAD-binding oxidoreductase [Verminephrobacter eiseniae]|uniref:FAD-binding oxidoreductase n=1 Tax=Verminephrobacter eiseniae TaxID=364317 RepID=UPI00223860D7|nr:FAD-binding oxidoreductase [Verminephrobacter eiseniae]